jgi:imidazole glycerol-phosphate synthase subunit HisF
VRRRPPPDLPAVLDVVEYAVLDHRRGGAGGRLPDTAVTKALELITRAARGPPTGAKHRNLVRSGWRQQVAFSATAGGTGWSVAVTVAVRVVACLDVHDGRVTKGVQFLNNIDVGDPLELARMYDTELIDELVFYDITASAESRRSVVDLIGATSDQVFIPFTVGGGVRRVQDFDTLLRAGADKISVNSGAIADPSLIREAANQFGAQCVVLSVDARRAGWAPSGFEVTSHGGRRSTDLDLIEWVQRGQQLGAGEIVVNSMDKDGTRSGFDLEMLEAVRAVSSVPVVASGGAGTPEHFVEAVRAGVDAVLAAGIFHSGQVSVAEVKAAISSAGFPVR